MADILKETKSYVVNVLTNDLDPKFLYHNLTHTQRVVKSTQQLLDFYGLDAKEAEDLLVAAWLHDVGYTVSATNHEEESCIMAREFLKSMAIDADRITSISGLIRATKRGYEPTTLSEEIIRDADASHLGKESFLETTEILREELSLLGIATYTPSQWRTINIKMLQKEHQFYTDYAKDNWQDTKDSNIKSLKKTKKKLKQLAEKEQLKEQYKAEVKDKSPDRGIETMFRVTLRNHTTLSDIADTKANILLSVNAIIISLVLSNLLPKLDNKSNEYLIYPTLVFVMFSVVSMILSVLATRPNVTSGKFKKEDVVNKKVNLLFFGNFHKMALHEFEWAIQEVMKDRDYLYSSLTKDLYFLGQVLDRKYKILRITYTVFLIGIILSVLSFIVAFKLLV